MVPHTPATSTVAGKKSSTNFATLPQKDSPPATTWNTYRCQSRIQDRPPQIQPHTVWRIQLHCSVWTLPTGFCMSLVSLPACGTGRSEEHTSELQSRPHLVCRLLLEK